jgi:hypothetical protein
MGPDPWEDPELEARLRAAVRAPGPELRARVLERCRRAGQEAASRRRAGRRWAIALAACLAAQWSFTAMLDGQRSAMLGGGGTEQRAKSTTHGIPDSASPALPSPSLAFTVGRRDPRLLIE